MTLVIFINIIPRAIAYDRDAAVNYADDWTVDDPSSTLHNPNYGYYPDNDCANYVSQCLIEGGFDLSAGISRFSSGRGVNDDGCIPFCDHLHTHLMMFQHVEHTNISTTESLPENLEEGDVIIFGDLDDEWKHAVIVVEGGGSDVRLNAHTNHRSHRPFSFFANAWTLAHIYHFKTAAETGNSQEFFGAGGYYGSEVLQVLIYEKGENFEGWILPNTDPSEQDMVVGEDTSSFSGCSYYLEGYCCDKSKGIPSVDRVFKQPWTCDSPNHWAYWVKKAIIYANDNDYSDRDTLDTIWLITDYKYSSAHNRDEILTAIGYPENMTTKNRDTSYYIRGRVFHDETAISGISVTLAGDISWKRVTNATGYYEFLYLLEGNYTITIDEDDFIPEPSIREYRSLNTNQDDQDFTLIPEKEGFPYLYAIIAISILLVVIILIRKLLSSRQ